MSGFAETAKHAAISARMAKMGQIHEHLRALVGEDAIKLIAERGDHPTRIEKKYMYCVYCGLFLKDDNQDGIVCRSCKPVRSPKKSPCIEVKYCFWCGKPYQPCDTSIHHPSCFAGKMKMSVLGLVFFAELKEAREEEREQSDVIC